MSVTKSYENLNLYTLQPIELDKLLAKGWFRNGQQMYRSHLILLDEDLYTSINIRIDLRKHEFSKSLRKIYKKNQQRFEVLVRPLRFTTEKQALWEQHRNRLVGCCTKQLVHHFGTNQNIFDTWEVCVYDDKKLIAVSFFDIGENSIASLLGLFDQSYQKESLGLFTMVVEMELAKELNMTYYYPGYVLDRPSLFDYKHRLGNTQRYDWNTKRWRKFDHNYLPTVASETKIRLDDLAQMLDIHQISYKSLWYQFYLWRYFDHFTNNQSLLPSPLIFLIETKDYRTLAVSFDTDTQFYYIAKIAMYMSITDMMQMIDFDEKSLDANFYQVNPTIMEEVYIRSNFAEGIVLYLKAILEAAS
jgi:leucyl-tRNA---protein transferase